MRITRQSAVLGLLTLVCFVLCVSAVWAADNFTPIETVPPLTAGTSTGSVSFSSAAGVNAPDVQVCSGASPIYWICGNSSVQATVPSGTTSSTSSYLPATTCGIFRKGSGSTTCSAITASSTSITNFTAGEGH
jgi:hypothetical protein